MPNTISLTTGPDYLIARLYAPAEPGYRMNTFCKYNIQCPNQNYNLYYTMVRFNVEPPHANGQCLDFMRYQFTATGTPVPTDLCGSMGGLSDVQKSGVHGSGLTLDFRSNRVNTGDGFFLALTCTLPWGSRRKRSTERCTPSQTLTATVGQDSQDIDEPLKTADEYLEDIFPTKYSSTFELRIRHSMVIPRGSEVKYKKNTIFVVRDGKILNRFRRIRMMQVYNRIEGYLTYYHSAPSSRTLPGYGFLRIGKDRRAQYVQTIIDPRYLLNDEEELIIRNLFKEKVDRERELDEEMFTREKLDKDAQRRIASVVDCSVNRLAKLNMDSCSDAVRAVANFFLDTDAFQDFCNDP